MEALSIGCRNKHWSQCFNQILISSTGLISSGPAIVVQAALESRAACTTTAGPEVVRRGWIQSTLCYDLHGLTSHNLLSIYTVLRSTQFVFNLHGIQSTRSSIYSVFTLHGFQSQAKIIKRPYFVWIYTIFTLHGFRSTWYSIYTYFHLHSVDENKCRLNTM
jgi:hypothetical protein